MGELRAYALAVGELRGVVGATGRRAEEVRSLAAQAFAPREPRLRVRDLVGPLYRRVPGAPVLRDDEPTPADLELLLSGRPVPAARAAAGWRLVEAVCAGLAWSSVRVPDVDLPVGPLAATGLPVPPVDGLGVGWCPLEQATGLAWLADRDTWTAAATAADRPPPDLVVFAAR